MTDSRWKNLALEVIGCFVSALGLYSFAVAAGVPVTGVAGIGAILFRLFGLPIGVTNIIMNIPIVLICFKYLGKDFFFRSVRCMVLFAIFTDYVLAALPVYQGDRMLATICGGVISGVGDALIYMQNSSTGGLVAHLQLQRATSLPEGVDPKQRLQRPSVKRQLPRRRAEDRMA